MKLLRVPLWAFAAVFAPPPLAWAQRAPIPDPQGVDFDAEGVLKRRTTDSESDKRLSELRKQAAGKQKEGELTFISLPKLFAEAKKCIEAGQPLPDRIRFLGGMVKLQYIFVYPEDGDLVIAGPSEPYDSKVEYRPLGLITLRPVLQLDDLVTALRALGPDKMPERIGCDIMVTKEIAEACAKKLKEVAPKAPTMGEKKAADAIAEAGGKQPVVYYGIDSNTRFAFVCAEADYKLKELALGLLKSPVAKVKSYNSMITKPERHHRFSLDSNYEAILVSADRKAFELRGPSLKINTGLFGVEGGGAAEASAAAKDFISQCNKNFAELAGHIISWADLANLSDLTILAALIKKEDLSKKAGWDMSWPMTSKGYPVAVVNTPKFAMRLCNYHYAGDMLLFTHGGVLINPLTWVEKLTPDDKGELKDKPRRPQGEVWIETTKGK